MSRPQAFVDEGTTETSVSAAIAAAEAAAVGQAPGRPANVMGRRRPARRARPTLQTDISALLARSSVARPDAMGAPGPETSVTGRGW